MKSSEEDMHPNKANTVTMVAKESEREAQENNIIRRRRVPTGKPPFTLSQLKKAIPPHCFERSALRSFSYVVRDIVAVSTLMSFAVYIIPTLPSPLIHAAWLFYWFCQGCVLHGIWVLAHECGHHAFSDYQLLDDTVGFLLHSALLVPYFSFKYSHRRHHTNSGSIEKDEVLVPRLRSRFPWILNYLNTPPARAVKILVGLVTGWPFYLAFNMSGRPYPSFVSHYYPYSPIYSDRERAWVLLSDAGVLAGYYTLYRLVATCSVGWVVRMYGVPWVTVNMWLVLTVYLQHAHPALPRYDSTEWDWMRGGLVTVDRDYGVLNDVFHNISNTHVVHHFFPSMPQYHAVEATEAIKEVLGEYYMFDPTPIGKALWREVRECLYMEGEGEERKGVYWFKNEL